MELSETRIKGTPAAFSPMAIPPTQVQRYILCVGGDALIAPLGMTPERPKKRTRPYRQLSGRCGHRPLRRNGSFPHCRGRCPHRPAGCVDSALRQNAHACSVGFRADVGIGPYEETVRSLTVGGDALIAPPGALTARSDRTHTPIPSASGPMWASAPTRRSLRC